MGREDETTGSTHVSERVTASHTTERPALNALVVGTVHPFSPLPPPCQVVNTVHPFSPLPPPCQVVTTVRPLLIQVDEQGESVDVSAGVLTVDLLNYLAQYITK